jgi:hypothetical protein
MYYCYAYLREDGTPYYIGKGKGQRAYLKHPRANGLDLRPKDKNRIVILKEFEDEFSAYQYEMEMIEKYGRKCDGTGILRNMTIGGEGNKSIFKTYEERKQVEIERKRKWYYDNQERLKQKAAKILDENRDEINRKRRERRNTEPYRSQYLAQQRERRRKKSGSV